MRCLIRAAMSASLFSAVQLASADSISTVTAYYVSPSGNDSNPGTITQPFLTPAAAQAAMRRTSVKTTYFRAGTYNLARTLWITSADSNETWEAYPGDEKYSARFVNAGGGVTDIFWFYDLGGVISNVTIANLTLDGGANGDKDAAIFIGSPTNGVNILGDKCQNNSAKNNSCVYAFNTDNLHIQNITSINDYEPISVHVTDSAMHLGLYVTGNTLSNFQRMGIELQNNSAPRGGYGDVHVDFNHITTWSRGTPFANDIAVSLVTAAASRCNTVYGNTIEGTAGTGAWFLELGAQNTSVEGNTTNNIEYPFFLSLEAGSEIENNTMSGVPPGQAFNVDGGWDHSQWVGANVINGAAATGWPGRRNRTSRPAICPHT